MLISPHYCRWGVFVLLVVVGLGSVGRGDVGDFWVDLNLGSRHSEDAYTWEGKTRRYHETNLGLGATYELARWCDAKVGWFENSYERTSVYAVLNAKWRIIDRSTWSLAPGLAGGLVTGYRKTPEQTGDVAPWGMLTLSLEFAQRWRVNLGYLPSRLVVSNSVDVATLQISYKL